MNRTPDAKLSNVVHGRAVRRRADLDSRPALGRPARLAAPQPAERAPEANFPALQLAFDSLREPAPAGFRGPHATDRRLVYMSRDYAVDVCLEPRPDASDVLRGELLSRAGGPVPEVPAFLLEGEEIAGYARTGELGEFQLETHGAADLRLCLLLDTDRCIDLPIDLAPAGRTATET